MPARFLQHIDNNSILQKLDPRARIVSCLIFVMAAAFQNSIKILTVNLAVAVFLAFIFKIPLRDIFKRLLPVNLFLLVLWLIIPLSPLSGRWTVFEGVAVSAEGLRLCLRMTIKANSIMIYVITFIGTMDVICLGRALRLLKVPEKLINIFLFSVRYISSFSREYKALSNAMRARGFSATFNMHSFYTLGNLVGTLLFRSVLRSEKVMMAMKCRGWDGTFHPVDEFSFTFVDLFFCALTLLFAVVLYLFM